MTFERGMRFAALTLAAVVCSIHVGAGSSHGEGNKVSYQKLNYSFYGVHFLDAKKGWICGKSGYLFRTVDGGITWERQETGVDDSLFGVAFLNESRGIVVGENGLVMATEDSGYTWNRVRVAQDKTFLGVKFVDERTGMAVGDWGKVITTSDGGNTWRDVSLDEDVVLYDLHMTGPEEVWVAAEMGNVFHTRDGGKTWEKQELAEGTLFGITFGKNGNGFAVGIEGTVLRTTDGGEHWERSNVGKESLYSVAIGGDLAVAVGDAGTVVALAGDAWRTIQVPIELKARWMQCIAWLGEGRFFIAGAYSSIFFIENLQLTRP